MREEGGVNSSYARRRCKKGGGRRKSTRRDILSFNLERWGRRGERRRKGGGSPISIQFLDLKGN